MPTAGAMTNVLFVTWDGPGSTYLTSLFLPIFRALAARGFRFHVLKFGWGGEEEHTALRGACAEAGVAYRSFNIWRWPVALGSLASALAGTAAVRHAIRDWSIDLVMPRSYLPALAAIPAARSRGVPVLLDADGLPNDERMEFAAISGARITHRLLATIERHALRSADAITVRTPRVVEILAARSGVGPERFMVVANARDSTLFRPAAPDERLCVRNPLAIPVDAPLLLFVGTALSGKYRGDLVRSFFRLVHQRRPDSRLLFVMPNSAEARALMADTPELAAATVHASAAPADVPTLIGAADLGLSLIRATPSMQAASAIKTGEYLLCGVPVLASAGVGGIERILDSNSGRCLESNDPAALDASADWFCGEVLAGRERFSAGARRVGLEHFALDRAIGAYDAALRAALDAKATR